MTTQAKVLTVRVTPEEAQRAELLARVDEISVNELFRRALLSYFEGKQGDPAFMDRAKKMVARDADLVGGLR